MGRPSYFQFLLTNTHCRSVVNFQQNILVTSANVSVSSPDNNSQQFIQVRDKLRSYVTQDMS